MQKQQKVFIICPVRNVSAEIAGKIHAHVAKLESQGYSVHYPPRDTPQDDPVGNVICLHNHSAILRADEVHIWYDETSLGSHFDLGGLWMLSEILLGFEKRVILINEEDLPATPKKSFLNVIRYLTKKA